MKEIKEFVIRNNKFAIVTFMNGVKKMVDIHHIEECTSFYGDKYTMIWYWVNKNSEDCLIYDHH